MQANTCYCGSGLAYSGCCEPLILGSQRAQTAEALMRSRYSAFVLGETDYLRSSWHPDTRPDDLQRNGEEKWLGLKIRATEAGEAHDEQGAVEFVARYKIAGRGFRLHERSRFVRLNGRWTYLDGEQLTSQCKSDRNSESNTESKRKR